MRLARREIRQHVEPLRKENRALKRRVAALEKAVQPVRREIKKKEAKQLEQLAALAAPAEEVKAARITASWVKNTREKLSITQEEMAQLCKVSPSAVRSWEYDLSKPRGRNREALVALRKVGRRDVLRMLEAQES